MSCRHFLPDIIDLARREAVAPARERAALDHLRDCETCAAYLDQQRAMSAALRRLAAEPLAPALPIDDHALIAVFDGVDASRRRVASRAAWLSFAAALAMAAIVPLVIVRERPRPEPASVPAAVATEVSAAPTSPASVQPVRVGGSATVRKRPGPRLTRRAPQDATLFMVPPGANAWPRFESGELIRIDIPDSMLPALGLWPRTSEGRAVQADVLVGQDGLARAVRLVQ